MSEMSEVMLQRVMWVAAILTSLIIAAFGLWGCSGQAVFTAPDAEYCQTTWPDGTCQVQSKATGAGAAGEGIKGVASQSPPTAGPTGANGGQTGYTMFDLSSIAGKVKLGAMLLWGGVGIVVIGGVLCYWLPSIGIPVAAAGACLLAAAWYPWLLLIVALLALVIVGVLIVGYAKGKSAKDALSDVVNAVEASGGSLLDAVKDAVKDRVTDTSKTTAVIESVKE